MLWLFILVADFIPNLTHHFLHPLKARATPFILGEMKLLNFSFIPTSSDFGLLVLRFWLGFYMLVLHGWGKLMSFSEKAAQFPDPLGIGSTWSLSLATFAEVACSALLIVGFLTRFAALNLAITMGVAFFIQHQKVLVGQGSGELAFLYLAGYVTLFFSGGGRFAFEKD